VNKKKQKNFIYFWSGVCERIGLKQQKSFGVAFRQKSDRFPGFDFSA